MAKQINTRLMLKHDSLTNWNESSIVLKPGEVGVAYVDVATKDAHGNIIHVPTALMKVGENVEGSTKTFKELPFVSAVAADVYAWAKEQNFYVEIVGEGEAVASVEFKATETHPNGALVVTKVDLVTPTELATALEAYYTAEEVDAKIQEINGANEALIGRVEAVETTVNTTLPGQINAVDAKFADYTTTTAQQAIDAEQDRRLGVIEGDYVKAADIANFETKENVKKVADDLAAYQTSNDQALAGVKATADAAAVKTEVEAALNDKADKTTVTGIDGRLATVEGDYLKGADKTELQDQITANANAITALTDGIDPDKIDGVKDLIDYVDTHGAEVTGMKEDIQENADAIAAINNADTGVLKQAKDYADSLAVNYDAAGSAAAALEAAAADATSKANTAEANAKAYADGLAGNYDAAGSAATAETNAKGYADGLIATEVERANGAYDAKGSADTAKTEAIAAAKTETASQITTLGIADYAKSADVEATYRRKDVAITSDDLSDEVFVFNCGTASTVI